MNDAETLIIFNRQTFSVQNRQGVRDFAYICNEFKNAITMSLLKSILKMVVKAATDSASDWAEEKTSKPARTPQRSEPMREVPTDWEGYFAGILSTAFPQYSVRRNVAVTDLAGYAADEFQLYKTRPLQTYKAEWGAPYTFVLYQGGAPAGIVMLGSGSSHHKNVKYLIARMYAKKLGLPYINFYTQFPNERAYVIDRINKFMKA